MIFKKRSEVEVLSKKEVSSGVWCHAKIVLGNGHDYGVQYDCLPGTRNEVTVERVSRKVIRPCPPLVNGVENLEAGDVVEVFNDFSWQVATVLKAMGDKYYLVRLFESSRELQVHKVNTRVLFGKGSGREVVKSDKVSSITSFQKTSPQANTKLEVLTADNSLDVHNNHRFRMSHVVSAGMLKRAPLLFSPDLQGCSGNAQKMRAIEKEGLRIRVISGYPSSLKKVDAAANPQETLGETYMHSSNNKPRNGQCETERGKTHCLVNCFCEISSEANASDIDACSVGSCSIISNSQSKFSCCFLAGPRQEADAVSSDAESFYDCGEEQEKCTLSLGGDVTARIHSLELHAYRCTLEAFYASGSLSWEQEALLTNLRLSLHISNDEHLMELRNLVSSKTSIHIS